MSAGVFVVHERIERVQPHGEVSHTEHGLSFVVDGWFSMGHSGAPTSVEVRGEPGTVTLIPAGAPHRAIDGENLEYWMVGFCASCVRLDESHRLMRGFRDARSGALPVITIPKGRRAALLRYIRELGRESERRTPESPELVRSLLLLVLAEVHRAPQSAPEVPTGSLVAEVLGVIQRRGLEPISLRDVAQAVHRSPAHVASTVKRATGYTVGEWIVAARVAEAAARLAHTDDSLDAIAEHVGWRDKTHFIRQFRKAHGVTPAAWRRTQRARHRH
jgi:AraC family transcriptional regulator, transcriptional activator of pobA